jgi:hypothetical protein
MICAQDDKVSNELVVALVGALLQGVSLPFKKLRDEQKHP